MSTTSTPTKSGDTEFDVFTPEFKRLKARNPPPDLTEVLDFSNQFSVSSSLASKIIIPYPVCEPHLTPVTGLMPCLTWKAYHLSSCPGLIVVQNPFLDGYQRYWVQRCLQGLPSDARNITNLSALGGDRGVDLWHEFALKKSEVLTKQDPLRKLRWTTLGYHYNWTAKEYSEDEKADFPKDVKCLTQYVAACLGFPSLQAEAAIINYYHLDSTLAGHTDHSEIDHSAPLFSFSFGQTAIFMIGGNTKAVKPISLFLKSGDICVMSGECRLAYHAVPRILAPSHAEAKLPACFNTFKNEDQTACKENISAQVDVENSTRVSSTEKSLCSLSSDSSRKSNEGSYLDKTDICEQNSLIARTSYVSETHAKVNNCEMKTSSCVVVDNSGHLQGCQRYECDVEQVNSDIEKVVSSLDFTPFGVYLQSSRVNLNVRQVLPSGVSKLPMFD